MFLSIARLCSSPHSALDPIYHPPVIFLPLTAYRSSLLSHVFSIFDMSQPSSLSSTSSTFRRLFDAALQDYKDKTGNTLADHPIAKQLETCESVNSITAILREQARSFREFRESDGKLMKALNSLVDVLCAPSISSALNVAIGIVVRRKHSQCTLFLMASTANPACKSNIRWLRHLTRRMSLFFQSHLHISIASNSPRRSKKCVLAMMHWSISSHLLKTS
jgi:hypothetical protein